MECSKSSSVILQLVASRMSKISPPCLCTWQQQTWCWFKQSPRHGSILVAYEQRKWTSILCEKWGWNQPLCSNHNNLLKHYDDFMSHYSNTSLLVIHTYAALRACNLFPQTRLVVHVRVLGNCIKTSWAITKEEYNIAKNEKTPFTTLTEISNQCTMDISCLTIASPWPLWKEMHKAWEIDYLGSL